MRKLFTKEKFEAICSFENMDEYTIEENLELHFKYIVSLKQALVVLEKQQDEDIKKLAKSIYLASIETFKYKVEHIDILLMNVEIDTDDEFNIEQNKDVISKMVKRVEALYEEENK